MRSFGVAVFAATLALVQSNASADYVYYQYTAQIDNTTTIADGGAGITFTAGDSVTGGFYVDDTVGPVLSWWNEVATYSDSLASISFQSGGVDLFASGAGDVQVHNNRRLVAGGAPFTDTFFGSLVSTDAGASMSATPLGGGLSGLSFNLGTSFTNPGPTALTSTNLPFTLDPLDFDQTNSFTVDFADLSQLTASFTGFSISTVSTLPEPGAATTLMSGLAILVSCVRRRRRG